jgi:hypothetical protein
VSKITEGPWEVDGVEIRASASHSSERICEMAPGFSDADAQLIAAAPDLLKALQAVKVFMAEQQAHAEGIDVWVKVNRSIAKALGK